MYTYNTGHESPKPVLLTVKSNSDLHSDDKMLLFIPRANLMSVRAFSHAASRLWNSLPSNIR